MTTPDAVRSTVADVDLDAVAANLTSIRDRAKADVIAVVKADAYGHGAEAVAEISFEAGAVMVAVATVEEGLALREAGVNGPILVFFGPTDSSEVAHAVAQDLVLTVWDQARARAISEAATALRRTARVHFKVDTGLTRLGAPTSEAAERLREIRALPRIEVDGIFTHLATADDPDTSNDQAQLARFQEVLGAIQDRPRLVHAVASAGVAAFGQVEGVNAVRPGLAIYGVHPAAHLGEAGHGPTGQDPAALADLLDGPDQEPPFGPLDDGHVRGVFTLGDLGFVHPLEIGPVEVSVGDLQLDAVLVSLARHGLAVHELPGHHRAVGQRHADDSLGPEEAHAVVDDE